MKCPACNEEIVFGECGGEGEGLCADACWSDDIARGVENPELPWLGYAPPTRERQAEILRAHGKAGILQMLDGLIDGEDDDELGMLLSQVRDFIVKEVP